MSKIILITGGARSGKSRFAEELARKSGKSVAYLATAEALDQEMTERIAKHKSQRPSHWLTLEEPIQIDRSIAALNGNADLILLDCLTLWVSNLIHQKPDYCAQEVEQAGRNLIIQSMQTVRKNNKTLIFVSNEVGMGIIPDNPLNRVFSDMTGRINQIVSAEADEVYFMVSGIPLKVK